MIGVLMPYPKDTIIANLNQQMEQLFGTGKSVQLTPTGVSGETSLFGASDQRVGAEGAMRPFERGRANTASLNPSRSRIVTPHIVTDEYVSRSRKS